MKNFTEIVPGKPLSRALNATGIGLAKYSDFEPVEGCLGNGARYTAFGYCGSLLIGALKKTTDKLQRVLNAAAKSS